MTFTVQTKADKDGLFLGELSLQVQSALEGTEFVSRVNLKALKFLRSETRLGLVGLSICCVLGCSIVYSIWPSPKRRLVLWLPHSI